MHQAWISIIQSLGKDPFQVASKASIEWLGLYTSRRRLKGFSTAFMQPGVPQGSAGVSVGIEGYDSHVGNNMCHVLPPRFPIRSIDGLTVR